MLSIPALAPERIGWREGSVVTACIESGSAPQGKAHAYPAASENQSCQTPGPTLVRCRYAPPPRDRSSATSAPLSPAQRYRSAGQAADSPQPAASAGAAQPG